MIDGCFPHGCAVITPPPPPPFSMDSWEQQLKYAQSLLDEWIKCQRTWMYLEPIFGSEDIMRQVSTSDVHG